MLTAFINPVDEEKMGNRRYLELLPNTAKTYSLDNPQSRLMASLARLVVPVY